MSYQGDEKITEALTKIGKIPDRKFIFFYTLL